MWVTERAVRQIKIRQIKRNVALVFGFFIYISAVSPGRLLVFASVKGMFV